MVAIAEVNTEAQHYKDLFEKEHIRNRTLRREKRSDWEALQTYASSRMVSPRAKEVFLLLWLQRCGRKVIYPGVKSLAQMLGVSRDPIQRSLKELREAGWIKRISRAGPYKNDAYVFPPLEKIFDLETRNRAVHFKPPLDEDESSCGKTATSTTQKTAASTTQDSLRCTTQDSATSPIIRNRAYDEVICTLPSGKNHLLPPEEDSLPSVSSVRPEGRPRPLPPPETLSESEHPSPELIEEETLSDSEKLEGVVMPQHFSLGSHPGDWDGSSSRKKKSKPKKSGKKKKNWEKSPVGRLAELFKEKFKEAFPEQPKFPIMKKHRGQIKQFLEGGEVEEEDIAMVFTFALENWRELKVIYNWTGYPHPGLFLSGYWDDLYQHAARGSVNPADRPSSMRGGIPKESTPCHGVDANRALPPGEWWRDPENIEKFKHAMDPKLYEKLKAEYSKGGE